MSKEPDPIVLSGRVFVAKLLAHDRPDLEAPAKASTGDLKLLTVPASRAGGKAKEKLQHYTGFFTAYLSDGTSWRKFNLRAGAAVKATYVSNADRQHKLEKAIAQLRTLTGRTAVWGHHGFEVCAKAQPAKGSGKQQRGNKAAAPACRSGESAPATSTPPPARPRQLLLF